MLNCAFMIPQGDLIRCPSSLVARCERCVKASEVCMKLNKASNVLKYANVRRCAFVEARRYGRYYGATLTLINILNKYIRINILAFECARGLLDGL